MFWTEEAKIKREIRRNALKLAEEQYHKDIAFRALKSSDLHYAIIQDLMHAAKFTGLVTIEFKDGTKMRIEDKGDRERLKEGVEGLF